jgi:hypothetical protein
VRDLLSATTERLRFLATGPKRGQSLPVRVPSVCQRGNRVLHRVDMTRPPARRQPAARTQARPTPRSFSAATVALRTAAGLFDQSRTG